MDVVIKNMEKPTNCFTCILSEVSTDFGKLVCLRLGKDCNNTILEDCPLVELPPHGRLIDADKCGKILLDKYTEGLDKWDDFYRAGYRYALKHFSQAPTVLEASVVEESVFGNKKLATER